MKVKLTQLGNKIIVDGDALIYDLVKRSVAARPEGYRHMPKYKAGVWDGYLSLFDKRTHTFPVGLLERVMNVLQKHGLECELHTNNHIGGDPPVQQVEGFTLLPYQYEAVRLAITHQRGVLEIATNGGKTLIMASIIKSTGMKAIVVVPTRALMHQTVREFGNMLGEDIGMVGDGRSELRRVSVVVMASLKRFVDKYHNFLETNVTFIIDECHHSRSDTIFYNALDVPATYRIGVSGSPLTDKLGDLRLMSVTGKVLCTITNADLIDLKVSVPPKIFMIPVEMPQVKTKIYGKAYKLAIVHNRTRNRYITTIVDACRSRGNTLILVNYIAHATNLKALIPDATVATGQSINLFEILTQARAGDVPVLIATSVFGEGVDIPLIHTLIIAAGGESRNQLIQRVGRGLRQHATKTELFIFDFIDDTNDYLLEHTNSRLNVYLEEGFEVDMIDDINIINDMLGGSQ